MLPSDVLYPGGDDEPQRAALRGVPIAVLLLWLAFYKEARETALSIAPDSPAADAALAAMAALLVCLVKR